jgi:hypothetical protein
VKRATESLIDPKPAAVTSNIKRADQLYFNELLNLLKF